MGHLFTITGKINGGGDNGLIDGARFNEENDCVAAVDGTATEEIYGLGAGDPYCTCQELMSPVRFLHDRIIRR